MQFIAVACSVSENVVRKGERAKTAAALLVPKWEKSPGNEVASAPGAGFLQTPGLHAFEIEASLVGDDVEENSFFSKALNVNVAENCCSRSSTEKSDRTWLGLPL